MEKENQPSSPPDARRALHAYLSDDAHQTWHGVAAELGVSVAGMLEAMAGTEETDPEQPKVPTDAELDVQELGLEGIPNMPGIIKKARKIDADRRRR